VGVVELIVAGLLVFVGVAFPAGLALGWAVGELLRRRRA
jgi:membrane protein insertase Oxa1/YidC/SpoIIIJ